MRDMSRWPFWEGSTAASDIAPRCGQVSVGQIDKSHSFFSRICNFSRVALAHRRIPPENTMVSPYAFRDATALTATHRAIVKVDNSDAIKSVAASKAQNTDATREAHISSSVAASSSTSVQAALMAFTKGG